MLLLISILIACTAVISSYLAQSRIGLCPFDQVGWITSVSWNH
jgi:hypothetical protein